jgi:Tfp pilus assembly protein FimV
VVAVTRRSWKPLLAPAAFLLAATIAVVVLRGAIRGGHATSQAPPPRPAHAAPVKRTPPPARHRVYTVRAGDTLSAIAARSGVSLARIMVLNPKLQPTTLFIGEKIRLG